MSLTASKLRQDIYRILDRVLETGEPVEIERRGRILRIVPDAPREKLGDLVRREGYLRCEPEELVHLDWSDEWRPDPRVLYLDTHAAAQLYAGRPDLFPEGARRAIEERSLLLSPAVLIELEYLFEIGRTGRPGAEVVTELGEQLGIALCPLPFPAVARAAARQGWTRDPFDRLIVGQAAAAGAPLLTKDRMIREHYPQTLW